MVHTIQEWKVEDKAEERWEARVVDRPDDPGDDRPDDPGDDRPGVPGTATIPLIEERFKPFIISNNNRSEMENTTYQILINHLRIDFNFSKIIYT